MELFLKNSLMLSRTSGIVSSSTIDLCSYDRKLLLDVPDGKSANNVWLQSSPKASYISFMFLALSVEGSKDEHIFFYNLLESLFNWEVMEFSQDFVGFVVSSDEIFVIECSVGFFELLKTAFKRFSLLDAYIPYLKYHSRHELMYCNCIII